MAKLARLVTLAAVAIAAMLLSAAPASAAPDACPAPYDPLAVTLDDTVLIALDLNHDGTICVLVLGDEAVIVDNSAIGVTLPIGLPGDGWTLVSTGDVNVTIGDVDQRGNRNQFVAAFVCGNNNGNSCVSNNKLHHILSNVKIVFFEDVTVTLPL